MKASSTHDAVSTTAFTIVFWIAERWLRRLRKSAVLRELPAWTDKRSADFQSRLWRRTGSSRDTNCGPRLTSLNLCVGLSIPKPGGGERHLGIPAVRDRVVQQALLDILQPIFDPHFHPSSYGYRPGRSCQQAVAKATMFIRQYDRVHVVDMDLSKCFDRLDHDLIVASIRRRVTDGSILDLIRDVSDERGDGGWQLGSHRDRQPAGRSDFSLDFERVPGRLRSGNETSRPSHCALRRRHPDRVPESNRRLTHAPCSDHGILEGMLQLTVNREKTHQTHAARGVKFLGVEISLTWTRIQAKKVAAFKDKVRQITRRNSPVNLEQVIADLNPVLRGFSNYFRMANCKGLFRELAGWIRRRLRAKQLSLMEETRSSPPPPAAAGLSGRIRGDAHALVAQLGQSPRELGHAQCLAERTGTVRFGSVPKPEFFLRSPEFLKTGAVYGPVRTVL